MIYELETKAKADSGTHIPAGSTVEDWKTEVANPLRGNSNVALALGTFFAAPLLRFSSEPGGGFHLYGPSTIGKTMVSAVGQSIWGYPHETADLTFGRSWGGSEAGNDALASARADLGLALDEITLTDKRTASQSVYKWASGTKGPRATSSGDLRTTMHSSVLVLSTGERSLAEFLDTEIQEGCKRRMSDVPAEVGEGTAFETIPHAQIHIESKRLFDAMKRHHGAVGREWLRYLVNLGPAKFIPLFNEARRAWLALPEVEKIATGVHPQVRAVVNRFALEAAVLRMVIAAGLLPWTVEETDTGIIACMSRWAKQRGNLDTAGELLRGVDRARTTITTTLTDRYIHLRKVAKGRLIPAKAADKVKQKTPKEFDGYVKPDRVLIWPEAWRRLCEGHDPIKVAEHLQRQKVLMPGARKGESARTETILGKSGRFYVLRREWLGGGA